MKSDKSYNELVSIIIRSKNEERWIEACLQNIKNQDYKNVEIILVDNYSTDKTIQKANKYKVKLVKIKNFLPGKAINFGIRKSKGSIIVCLSAHCIPTNNKWLKNLIKNLKDPNVAGVYGRQEPLSYSSDIDKRDLITVFGLDKKIQVKDPFFHNANSAFLKKTWNKFPFDENVTNIEDRVWGHQVIKNKLKIVYEPDASVYHYHGIHQNLNQDRAKKIVNIIESIDKINNYKKNKNIKIAAIIPIKQKFRNYKNKKLIDKTLNDINKSKNIDDVYLSIPKSALKKNIKFKKNINIILRPQIYSQDHISVIDVLKYSIEYLENKNKFYDVIVCLQENYPNRPSLLIDKMINQFLKQNLETLIAGRIEKRTVWEMNEKLELKMLYNGFLPKEFKKNSIALSYFGMCSISYSQNFREKNIFNKNFSIYNLKDSNIIELKD